MEVTRNGALGPSVVQVVELVNILERAPALILPQVPAGQTVQAWVQTKILSSAATTIAQVKKIEIINTANNNNNKCFICMTVNELQYCKSY